MTLEAMFPGKAVIVPMRATSVDEALVELAEGLAHAHGLSAGQVLTQLREREQLGSTAIGEGLALPHGRGEIERTVGAIGISPEGIPWGDVRVHVVIALLSPLASTEHVKALAKLGRMFADGRLAAELRAAASATQAWERFVGSPQ